MQQEDVRDNSQRRKRRTLLVPRLPLGNPLLLGLCPSSSAPEKRREPQRPCIPRWEPGNEGNSQRILLCSLLLALIPAAQSQSHAQPAKPSDRPNILIVLADDLGYGDLACYGHPQIKTSNLDKFAAEGLRLTDCYSAAANCSPSRTGLMTGRTPFRVGIHNWIPLNSPMHVRRSEITIATLLRGAGYSTCHVGKWHLNGRFNQADQPQPSDHGFDHWFSTQNNALPCHRDPDNFVRNGQPAGQLKGFSASLVIDEAIDWLNNRRDKQKPFFLFVCFHEPHEPIASDHRFTDLYPGDGEPSPFDPAVTKKAAHHGNVTQMDHAFGRLMTTLDEERLRAGTLVLFTSDNGPAITSLHPHGSPGPLRDKKGYMYEGGIRVPGLIRWPGHSKPASVSAEPVSGVDLLPTLCKVAGIEKPADRPLDGASFLPIFNAKPIHRTTPLYWQFNAARGKPKVAMRQGDWKILATLTGPELKPGGDIVKSDQQAIKTAELDKFELYKLSADIAERSNVATQHPERLAQMTARLKKLYHEVRTESPTWPAWQWPRLEGQRINAFRQSLKQ